MIPVVDQLADAQDLVASLYKILYQNDRSSEVWIDFAISIVGCAPTLGSAAKGVLKLVKRTKSFTAITNFLHKIGFGNAEAFINVLIRRLRESKQSVSTIVTSIAADLVSTIRTLPRQVLGDFSDNIVDFVKRAPKEVEHALHNLTQQLERIIREATPKLHRLTWGADNSLEINSRVTAKATISERKSIRVLIDAYDKMYRSKFRREMQYRIKDSYPHHPLSFLLGDSPKAVLSNSNHPLRKVLSKEQLRRLNNPADPLYKWLNDSQMQLLSSNKLSKYQARADYQNLFAIATDAGHGTGKQFLEKFPEHPQRFYLEDSVTNVSRKMDSIPGTDKAVMKRGAEIEGVWVEETTLQMWLHSGYVDWSVSAKLGGGWTDTDLHKRFASELTALSIKSNQ